MKAKKWFPLARKSVSASRNKAIFQKLDLLVSTDKNLQIKEYCFNYTESRFPLAGMANSFKNMFQFDGKNAFIDRNIQKIKENDRQQQ